MLQFRINELYSSEHNKTKYVAAYTYETIVRSLRNISFKYTITNA